jgi:putative N-acetyltransferase (TIGR04045 family)
MRALQRVLGDGRVREGALRHPKRSPPPGALTRAATGDCRVAAAAAEADLARHFAIREAVFVREQGLFEGTDRDARDDQRATLHVVGWWDGEPAGAVRLYPLDEAGLWKGDRLAVLPGHRQHRLGEHLVRFAVRTAGEHGGTRMIAHIQLSNVRFFRSLGWTPLGDPTDYVGQSHQLMEIPLS